MPATDSVYAVDYETYYDRDYSLRKMIVRQYVEDPRFDPYLVSIFGPGIRYCGVSSNAPWEQIAGHTWLAHNANFDMQAHNRAVSLGLVPMTARPREWICTADLSVYRQAPRNLQGAASEILGLKLDKGVRDRMKGRHFNELQLLEQQEVIAYARKDAEASYGIWETEGPMWPDWERRLSAQTRRIGQRGVGIDTERVAAGITHLKTVLWEAEQKIPWAASDGALLSPAALAEACRLAGIPAPASTAEDDPACEAWEAEYGASYPWVRAMREYRKANKALRFLEALQNRAPDGIMPFSLKYCGAAATARWSGDSGLNMQNLPREDTYGIKLRECLVARPGKKFIIADLHQIEPIVLAWLIGDEAFLAYVRAGRDTYEAHARSSMRYGDPRPLKEVDKQLRSLAKARVLGLSYGASHEPFIRIAKSMAGLDLDPVEAQRAVVDFRHSNPLITRLWQRLDYAFKLSRNAAYTLELPSGREIRYFDVSSRGWTARVTRGEAPRRFWGSKLVENLVQGTARDVFADCLLRIEDAGFDIVWHVHDEVIVEVDEDDQHAAAEVTQLMSIPPQWAPGLPVSAEAIESTRYTK